MGRSPLFVLSVCLLLAGCGRSDPPPAVVGMGGRSFLPAEIAVRAGQAVEWRNTSDAEHDVAGREEESFDSGLMAVGERFKRVFQTPGRYPYICSVHPGMTGTVVVTR